HLGAVGIRLERALDRLDLAAQPADTLLQLGLLMNRVSHMRRRSHRVGGIVYVRRGRAAHIIKRLRRIADRALSGECGCTSSIEERHASSRHTASTLLPSGSSRKAA